MSTKMKPDNWATIPRNVKLAYVLYPSQAPQWAQDQMSRLAANEGKRSPVAVRGGITRMKVEPDYSRVPGLIRKK